MNKQYTLNTLLAAVLGAAVLGAILVRTFLPRVILPQADIPNLLLISLAALVWEHYLGRQEKRCWLCVAGLAAVSFGLLPFAACFVGALEALKLGVLGALVFTAAAWLFDILTDRLSTGPAAKLAPIVSAFCLYLAAQGFLGLI